MCGNEKNPEVENALFMKLSYQRCESYIVAARSIIHLSRPEEPEETPEYFANLWEILNLMYHEMSVCSKMLDSHIESISYESA